MPEVLYKLKLFSKQLNPWDLREPLIDLIKPLEDICAGLGGVVLPHYGLRIEKVDPQKPTLETCWLIGTTVVENRAGRDNRLLETTIIYGENVNPQDLKEIIAYFEPVYDKKPEKGTIHNNRTLPYVREQ